MYVMKENHPINTEMAKKDSLCSNAVKNLSCTTLTYEEILQIKHTCPELEVYVFLLLNTSLSEDTLKKLILDQEITAEMREHFLIQLSKVRKRNQIFHTF